jgi:hypothetical protein
MRTATVYRKPQPSYWPGSAAHCNGYIRSYSTRIYRLIKIFEKVAAAIQLTEQAVAVQHSPSIQKKQQVPGTGAHFAIGSTTASFAAWGMG